jgi:hypothetical protein
MCGLDFFSLIMMERLVWGLLGSSRDSLLGWSYISEMEEEYSCTHPFVKLLRHY